MDLLVSTVVVVHHSLDCPWMLGRMVLLGFNSVFRQSCMVRIFLFCIIFAHFFFSCFFLNPIQTKNDPQSPQKKLDSTFCPHEFKQNWAWIAVGWYTTGHCWHGLDAGAAYRQVDRANPRTPLEAVKLRQVSVSGRAPTRGKTNTSGGQ